MKAEAKTSTLASLDEAQEKAISETDDGFRLFYRKHMVTVRNVMYRIGIDSELDDAVQDCFIKAWQNLSQFSGKSSEKTWITRIAVNTAYDYLKAKKKRPTAAFIDNIVPLIAANQHGIEATDIVLKLLQKLKQELRVVLVLSLMEGFSMEEIAETLAIPVGTVKSRLHSARKESESALKKMGVKL